MFEAENRFKFSSNQKILMEVLLAELCRMNKEVIDLAKIISGLEAVKKKSLTEKSPESEDLKSEESIIPESITEYKPAEPEIKNTVQHENSVKKADKTNPGDSELIKKLKELFDLEEYKFN